MYRIKPIPLFEVPLSGVTIPHVNLDEQVGKKVALPQVPNLRLHGPLAACTSS